ncbi:MAG: T9SS C-terminal target domain-containing protein [Flavobacteriales bacterium]|nr:MAG: T9SS C-terminal target domain-containing protein [Flavobacteriales bacterium]
MRQIIIFLLVIGKSLVMGQDLPIQVMFEVDAAFSPQYPEKISLGISSVDTVLSNNGVKYLRRFEKGRGSGLYIYVARVSDSLEQKSLLNSLQELPEIIHAEEDFIAFADNFPTVVPNDQHYSQQYALKNNGTFSLSPSKSGADISMEEAWAIEQGDTNVVMAVLDSGTKLDHPEFLGRIWVNPGEIPGNNQDNDNNGYIDDINGWNFISNNNDPSDDHGHGTAVAGVIASNGNNSIGFAGVDWNCKIMTLKVLNQNNSGPYSGITEAFYYAADNGAHILNASLGGFSNSIFLHQSVIYALNHNVLSVVSTGNENSSVVRYPSAYPEAMGIGATNAMDERAQPFGNNTGSNSGSNFGSHVSVVAPGNFIFSLRYTSNTNYSYRFSGTSFACPHVAGLASLLKAQDTSRTPAQIRAIIESTAEDQVGNPIEDTPGWDQYYGHGRINAFRALVAKFSTPPTSSVSTTYFEVEHPGGIHKIPYYGNQNLITTNNDIQLAVIPIQNLNKNSQEMFQLFNTQIQSLGLSNEAVVIAPQFLDENDVLFHHLDSSYLYWAGDSISIFDGYPSLNSNASIESFAVIDSLISKLKNMYPSLCQIIVVGNQYGGSFTQRYALLSIAENTVGIPIRYVVGNANWYTYLNNERKVSNALDQFSVPSSCSDYNTWPFGLDNRNISNYVGSVSVDSILSRNAKRELVYVLGALDTETQLSELGLGCLSASQGENRHERGVVFSNYLVNFFGSNTAGSQQTISLQGVGKEAAPLFSHTQSLQAIYSIPGVVSSWELYDPPIHSLPPPSVFHLNDIFFTDSMVGWVAGNFRRIFYTNDGGVTWNSPVVDGTLFQELHSVHFPNQTRGFVTANNGNILRSNNGGLNWFTVTTPVNTPLRDIHMLNTSPFLTGWVVGDNGVIMYSNTGGAWSLQNSGTSQQLNAVHFTSTTHGVAVGNSGIILRTTNGGNTWQNVNSPTNSQLWDVAFTSTSVGFAVGNNGVILRTLNGGSTWSLLASPTSENLKAIDFSMNIGIAVGENGAIVRTENSGGSWSLQYSGLVRNLNGVFTHSPTNAFAVGDTSTLLQTLEGGALCFGDINLGPDTSISHLDTLVLRLPVNCFSNQNILWNTGHTGEKLVISASNYPLGHNQFFVQIETNGCIAYDTVNVFIYYKDFPNAPIISLSGCDSASGSSGITFTQSGIFIDSILSQSGIQDSVIVHQVEVNYATEVIHQFSGCDSVIGHFGQTIYQSTVLRDTFPTVKSCDSIVIQEIEVFPSPIASVQSSTISACVGDSIHLSADTTNAQDLEWFKDGQFISSGQNLIVNTSGNYSVIATNINGCHDTSQSVSIVFHPPPELSFQTIPVLCSNDLPLALNIASPLGGTYSGSGVSGGSFDPSIVGVGVHPITYTYTDSNGCVNSIQDSITVNLPPTPVFTNTSNLEACTGDSIQLQLIHNVGQTYQWYKDGVLIQGENQANLTVNESGNYYSIVESNSCFEYSDTLNVFIRPLPMVSINGPDTLQLCIGDSTLLQATTGGIGLSFQWFFNSNPILGATQGVLSTSDAGQYFLIVEDSFGCVNLSESVWVVSQFHPQAIITPSDTASICDGDTLIIQANTGVDLTYQWYHNNIILPGETGATLHTFAGGTYQVKITENALCESMSSPLLVTVNPLPSVNLNATKLNFCSGDSVFLTADSANFIYRWMINGNTISGVGQHSVFVNNPGQYSVEVTDENGCKALSNILTIDYFSPPVNQDEICAVSFDSASGGNRIVWEPTPGNRSMGFVIHREQGGVFDSIGYQDFASAGNYIDLLATPSLIAHSYRISTFDSCGAYSDTSSHSSVILLSFTPNHLNQVEMQWTAYEGANILNYKVWRKPEGGSYSLLDSLTPGILTYTDSFPTRGLKTYLVTADLPHVCTYADPIDGLTSISGVLSNTIEVSSGVSVVEFDLSKIIQGFPNPTRDIFHIQSSQMIHSYVIYDFLGHNLKHQTLEANTFSVDLGSYAAGAYFIRVNGDFGSHLMKVVLVK